jgi:SAM-dependent methyltransferase
LAGVIEALLPETLLNRPGISVVKTDWLSLPFPDGSFDIAFGDGVSGCFPHPRGFRSLAQTIRRVLRPGGTFVARCYVQPNVRETAAQLLTALRAGRVATIDQFKLRLYSALQHGRKGMPVANAYEVIRTLRAEGIDFSRDLGWPEEAVDTFDLWRDSSSVYYIPPLSDIRLATKSLFDEANIHYPSYPMGACCPMITWTSTKKASVSHPIDWSLFHA